MRVVIADLAGTRGFVNKDTIVGGFGARFQGFTWTTRLIERMRKVYQNVPSVHAAYLAAIFNKQGHDVIFSQQATPDADVALLLTSIVEYRNEMEWADSARRRGIKVGLFGAMATHATDLVADHADFVIKGEPEEAAIRIANGEMFSGVIPSRALSDLDMIPFPAWHL